RQTDAFCRKGYIYSGFTFTICVVTEKLLKEHASYQTNRGHLVHLRKMVPTSPAAYTDGHIDHCDHIDMCFSTRLQDIEAIVQSDRPDPGHMACPGCWISDAQIQATGIGVFVKLRIALSSSEKCLQYIPGGSPGIGQQKFRFYYISFQFVVIAGQSGRGPSENRRIEAGYSGFSGIYPTISGSDHQPF